MDNNYNFNYIMPLQNELKRLGYGLPTTVTEQDALLAKLIINSKYSDLEQFTYLLNERDYLTIVKPAIRVYAYYINNPAQFNHNPHNIIGSAIRHMYNCTQSFMLNIHQHERIGYVKVRNKTIKAFSEQALSVWLPSSRELARKVKINTEMMECADNDLNKHDRIHMELFRQVI